MLYRRYKPLLCRMGGKLSLTILGKRLGTVEDCIQEAFIGLLLAAERYDPLRVTNGRKAKFITYATNCIYRYLGKRAMEEGIVRFPVYKLRELMHADDPCIHTTALPPSTNKEGEHLSFQDDWELGRQPEPSPFDVDDRTLLHQSVRKLDPRTRQILHLRFDVGLPLRTIGKQLHISKERVRQIQDRALADLREYMGMPVKGDRYGRPV